MRGNNLLWYAFCNIQLYTPVSELNLIMLDITHAINNNVYYKAAIYAN